MALFNNFLLTEEEIYELVEKTVFEEDEIEILCNRFVYLDRTNSGFVTYADLQMIPEFDANPFCHTIIAFLEKHSEYEHIDFSQFLQFLSIFSEKSDKIVRISFLFKLFNFNGNNRLSRQEITKVYGMMVPYAVDDKEVKKVFTLYDRNKKGYISKGDFTRLYNDDPALEKNMIIDFRKKSGTLKRAGFWDIIWPSDNNKE